MKWCPVSSLGKLSGFLRSSHVKAGSSLIPLETFPGTQLGRNDHCLNFQSSALSKKMCWCSAVKIGLAQIFRREDSGYIHQPRKDPYVSISHIKNTSWKNSKNVPNILVLDEK